MGAPVPLAMGSLIFEFTEALEGACCPPVNKKQDQRIQAASERLCALCRAPAGFPGKLLRDVRRLKRQLLQEDDRLDVVMLAAQLAEIGYAVSVRCALGGAQPAGAAASPGSCFRNLRHEFLFVRCEAGDCAGCELLVDPCFRDQFAIPQPTAAYRQLLASVPEEFVGTSMRLQPVVELLCAEMCASFESRGLTTPPWRRPAAMLSKFFPKAVKDIAVSSPAGSPPKGASPRGTSPPAYQAAVPLQPAPPTPPPIPLMLTPTVAAPIALVDLTSPQHQPHQVPQQEQQEQQQRRQQLLHRALSAAAPAQASPQPQVQPAGNPAGAAAEREAARQLARLWQAGYHNQGSPTYESDLSPPPSMLVIPQAHACAAANGAPQQQQQQQEGPAKPALHPLKVRTEQDSAADTAATQPKVLPPGQPHVQQALAACAQARVPEEQQQQQLSQVSSPLAVESMSPMSSGGPDSECHILVRVSELPQLQRRASGAVSLLSAQLAGNSNPASPTAVSAAVLERAPMLLPPSQMLGCMPQASMQAAQQPVAAVQQGLGGRPHPEGVAHSPAPLITPSAAAVAAMAVAQSAASQLLLAPPQAPGAAAAGAARGRSAAPTGNAAPAAATGQVVAHTGSPTAAAAAAAAAVDTIHINWCGGVIHKVKPRGVQQRV